MSLIGLTLAQIKKETPIDSGRLLVDEFGRVWKGVRGAAASTYTHSAETGTIVPLDSDGTAGDGTQAWLLVDQYIEDVPIPLGTGRLATGAAIPAFGAGTADGWALVDSEAFGLRWNDDTTTAFWFNLPLPDDLDADAPIVLSFAGFRVGSSDTTAALTVSAFFQTLGAAHTADADCGGNTTAFDGATTIVTEETLTIAAADVPADAVSLSISVVPSAALNDDDFVLMRAKAKIFRKSR